MYTQCICLHNDNEAKRIHALRLTVQVIDFSLSSDNLMV